MHASLKSLNAHRACLQRGGISQAHRAAVLQPRRQRARAVAVQAKDKTTGNAALDNALAVGGTLVDSAANLVPESVPRGVAKGGVAVVGALVAFWLLQKVVSTVLTITLLGGAAWFYFNYSGNSSSSGDGARGGGGSSGSAGGDDPNDPLSEARKIMDKYNK